MRNSDNEGTRANHVANIANDEQLLLGELGNNTTVLEVLGVTEENDGINLILDLFRKTLDGGSGKGRSLRVTTGGDTSLWALGVDLGNVLAHLADGRVVGAFWEEVGEEVGGVFLDGLLDEGE